MWEHNAFFDRGANIVLAFEVVGGVLALVCLVGVAYGPAAWERHCTLLGMLCLAAQFPLYWGWHRRLRSVLQQTGADICLKCGYWRKGVPRDHVCPECGQMYDAAAVARVLDRFGLP
ncbi:hypothetical protein RAS1_14650 [Phycisphaerae bacterium RAS1]|nr:hypothetical protein RAS1_14650 [Phycisphaerae bacterium RAS1]